MFLKKVIAATLALAVLALQGCNVSPSEETTKALLRGVYHDYDKAYFYCPKDWYTVTSATGDFGYGKYLYSKYRYTKMMEYSPEELDFIFTPPVAVGIHLLINEYDDRMLAGNSYSASVKLSELMQKLSNVKVVPAGDMFNNPVCIRPEIAKRFEKVHWRILDSLEPRNYTLYHRADQIKEYYLGADIKKHATLTVEAANAALELANEIRMSARWSIKTLHVGTKSNDGESNERGDLDELPAGRNEISEFSSALGYWMDRPNYKAYSDFDARMKCYNDFCKTKTYQYTVDEFLGLTSFYLARQPAYVDTPCKFREGFAEAFLLENPKYLNNPYVMREINKTCSINHKPRYKS